VVIEGANVALREHGEALENELRSGGGRAFADGTEDEGLEKEG
jgi:hypothetical protein